MFTCSHGCFSTDPNFSCAHQSGRSGRGGRGGGGDVVLEIADTPPLATQRAKWAREEYEAILALNQRCRIREDLIRFANWAQAMAQPPEGNPHYYTGRWLKNK